jgi:hypothetical protein
MSRPRRQYFAELDELGALAAGFGACFPGVERIVGMRHTDIGAIFCSRTS